MSYEIQPSDIFTQPIRKFPISEHQPFQPEPILDSLPVTDDKQYSKTARALDTAVLAVEVSPLNELLRGAVLGTFAIKGSDPEILALATAGATMVMETAAAASTARLLHYEKNAKPIAWARKKLTKVFKERDNSTELNPVAEIGVGYIGGTSVLALIESAVHPERSPLEYKSRNIKVGAFCAAIVGAQAYLVGKGIETPDKETIALSAAGIVIPFVGLSKLANLKKK